MKKIFFSIALTFSLFADDSVNTLNLEYIKSLQNPIERDFYINEYLKSDINPDQTYETLSLITNMNNEIFFNFAKKFGHDETLGVAQCMNMSAKELVNSYDDCIVAGLSIKDLSTLSAIDFDLIKQKISDKYPEVLTDLKIISAAIPFTKLVVQKNERFYNIYLNVTDEFRTKYFNYKLPEKTFNRIFEDKEKFNEFLKVSLTNSNLNYLNASLVDVDDINLNFNSSFLLALNAIRENNLEKATIYLNNALSKAIGAKEINKINFWQYLISQDKQILTQISNSNEVDFYSFLANELLENKIDAKNLLENIQEIDTLKKDLYSKDIALLYAISKVKSNFDEKKISENFKTGMFQLKPSIIKSLYESINQNYSIENLFKKEQNVIIAKLHLTSLEQKYNDIFQLIEAFDGTSILKKEDFFKDDRKKFEPFFNLEMTTNNNLDYQKEILLYFVVYNNSLTKKKKDEISLNSLCQKLLEPDHKQGE